LANKAIDDARRRVQQETLGHRGRRDDPLYRIRRLLVGHERLSDQQHERLLTMLGHGDRHGDVTNTYLAKELLRDVYDARTLRGARRRLRRFYEHCVQTGVRECRRLARTIRAWEAEVLAFHTTGRSNGPTEGINLLIKKVKRVGHGFRNFNNYRLRLLLHCGVQWQTAPTARVRGPSTTLHRVEPKMWAKQGRGAARTSDIRPAMCRFTFRRPLEHAGRGSAAEC
jgi:transposase